MRTWDFFSVLLVPINSNFLSQSYTFTFSTLLAYFSPMAEPKRGEADAYYGGGQQPGQMPQYPMQTQGNGAPYQQPPPNYGQNYGPQPGYQEGVEGKNTFNQAFKIDKPKWNDLWAGILVRGDIFRP